MTRQHRTTLTWAALVLIPMLPVVLFYAVFADQNYFELKNAARGLVTTGPIAAYIAIVWLGARIFKQVSSIVPSLDPLEAKLVGTSWTFKATSFHKTQRQGEFRISEDDGQLSMAGTFQTEDGHNVGAWESTMTDCEDKRLNVVYSLSDQRGPTVDTSTGMLQLFADADDPRRLSGTWVVLGREEAHGEIVCTKDTG